MSRGESLSRGGLISVGAGDTLFIGPETADQRIYDVVVTGLGSALDMGMTYGELKTVPAAPPTATVEHGGGDVYYGMAAASFYPSADVRFAHRGPFQTIWFDNTAGFSPVAFSLAYNLSRPPAAEV